MGSIMLRKMIIILLVYVFFGLCFAQDSLWEKIEDGLFIGEFDSPQKSDIGDSKITVVKIDPEYYDLKLFCASEYGVDEMTAKDWCKKYNLIAAVNAGMFRSDYRTNVGYMKNFDYINNANINKYRSVVAFNPISSENPRFRIFDIDVSSMDSIIENYNTVIQNLRLIKRSRENRWKQQSRRWSELALGEDKSGNILFIFSRSPYSMHDFNNILLQLPIDIECAQHLEGGPEATLYLSTDSIEIEKFGSYESGFRKDDSNDHEWRIPNVIGVVKKPADK